MLEKILDFIKSAGDYAMANQTSVDFEHSKMKSDRSHDVVTETDLEISRRFKTFVETEFSNLDYVIVDEESIASLGDMPMAEIKRHEYAFIIDPIDGTLTYSNGLPFYGISIGVAKNQRSVVGALYMPSLGLMVYSNETSAFVEAQGRKEPLTRLDETAALYANPAFHTEDYSQKDAMNILPLNLYSATVNCAYVAIGKLRGLSNRAYLWDIAGAYSIFEKTGVKIFDTATDQPIDLLGDDIYDDKLRIKEPKIICLPEHYPDFKKLYLL